MRAPSDSSLSGSYAYTELKGVQYGPGCLSDALPKFIEQFGVKRALVVTGRSLHTKTDVVRRVEAVLREHNAYSGETFWEIGEHSPVADIDAGVSALKRSNADVIVSVGGGSPVDASKVMIYRLHQESPETKFLPHIAIPTTLSAAEYASHAGYTNEKGSKVGISAPELSPAGIILDAELTLPTPERLWLSTGLRAVDHAVESLYRPFVPQPVKILCYAALADLFEYLRKSKANPNDIEARQKLQVASWMSLWPLKLGEHVFAPHGLSHALGHRLGATYRIGHGFTSCLTLPPSVALQAQTASTEHKRALAATLFYLRIPSTGNDDSDILRLSSEIEKLVTDLGLHTNLASNGVPREDLPRIAEQAIGNLKDPRYKHDDLVKILESIYQN
ncbi:alcohol dehydrogenase IV [Pyrrhoderma noxium]|uniref:Alcohol dehydrogenase IV n=1 Tax=Pyrrhoderma noxium TaxID=2282107 RepID=A0A286UJQ9_9AGAM|nr:alcohol dehydrogenase IV [Pyrrhoderma noxium]